MFRKILLCGNSLWYYFKLIVSACYRKQVREEKIEKNQVLSDLLFKDNLLEETSLISRTDEKGLIIYANQKFLEVAGYTLEECLGKNHSIINSGSHSKDVWREMYEVVIKKRKIWYHPKIINKSKNGELYYVKSWVQAEFDVSGKLKGFISIRHDITDLVMQQNEVNKKNTYLEHAAKILRHDMHSGINTYIPRGVSSLNRRLKDIDKKKLRIEAPIKMIEEGLKHTQKVYKGVYAFTNLVKPNAVLETSKVNLKVILDDYLANTAYKDQVNVDDLPDADVNDSLFCTAIDNLIRNGLKYNDSNTKMVRVYFDYLKGSLIVEDNGRGISQEDFDLLMQPYARKDGQKEAGSGLGLNICIKILEQHKFKVFCEKLKYPLNGTRITIKID